MPPPRGASGGSKPRPGCAGQGSNAGVVDYTTRQQNAHGIEEREVLYPWHPWAGRLARVNEVVERKSGDVFRRVCYERSMEIVQELPSWMLDRATRATVRVLVGPFVDLAALRVLRALLNGMAKECAGAIPTIEYPFFGCDTALSRSESGRDACTASNIVVIGIGAGHSSSISSWKSIHAPRRGRRSRTNSAPSGFSFDPRPREGGDRAERRGARWGCSFDPRPREGGDLA